jgi:3-oxoacyl-[acyl-carrier protein] reductase
MDLGIAGKTAIVCAASKGLGKGCARALAGEGVDLVINARTPETLEATAREIAGETGVIVTPVAADIATEAGRSAVLAACPEPDILVTNCGGPPAGDFRNWERDDWVKALDANMLTPIALMKACVDGMIAREFGRIVNITSASVKAPIPYLGLSNGARTGLTGFVAGLARQTVRHNVTINNLLPGSHATDRITELAVSLAAADGTTRGVRRRLRLPVLSARGLHHRPEPPPRRRLLPGDALDRLIARFRAGVAGQGVGGLEPGDAVGVVDVVAGRGRGGVVEAAAVDLHCLGRLG